MPAHQESAPNASLDAREMGLALTELNIFVGGFHSVCGNCQGNADLNETRHRMKNMQGEGCGIKWEYVTFMDGKDHPHIRPDLHHIDAPLEKTFVRTFNANGVLTAEVTLDEAIARGRF